jgi:Ca2+-binding RTX toxin-like protein
MKRYLCALILVVPVPVLTGVGPASAATPSCDAPTIVGTPKGDRLVGTSGRDVIVGRGGRDVIDGLAGNDVLCGGAGSDVLRGGPGSDVLLGGRDLITFDGRIGRMSHGDRLDGGPGDDRLDGGVDPRAAAVDITNAVLDTLDYRHAPGGVTVRLDQQSADGHGTDHIVVQGRYEVWATEHDDVIHGSDFQEQVFGYDGADVIRAGGDDDWIWADTGPSSADDDVVFGAFGNDFIFANGGSDRISGGQGRDQVSDDGLVGVDRLLGGRGDEDLLSNVMSAAHGEHADGGSGRKDYIWNTDDAGTFPDATMTCVGFEVWRSSGPWC